MTDQAQEIERLKAENEEKAALMAWALCVLSDYPGALNQFYHLGLREMVVQHKAEQDVIEQGIELRRASLLKNWFEPDSAFREQIPNFYFNHAWRLFCQKLDALDALKPADKEGK